jgi:arginase
VSAPPLAVGAVACHATDAGARRGAALLASEVAAAAGVECAAIGEARPGGPASDYVADLDASRGCFRAAAGHVERALEAGARPLVCAGDCSICLATLAAVLAARPDARVLWLDAHGDFNAPGTTPSGFLGGMCLAGACGVWDAGVAPPVEAGRVVLCGVRDLDEGERGLVEASGAAWVQPGEGLAERTLAALGDAPVYVHLDVDVLEAGFFQPVRYPAPGGVPPAELAGLLAAVADGREVVGVEVTALGPPERSDGRDEVRAAVRTAIAPLLAA